MLAIKALIQTLFPLPVVPATSRCGICARSAMIVLPGDRRQNVDSFGARCSCKIALKAHNLVHAHALGRINFVPRNGWTFRDVTRSYSDSKLGQRLNENLLDLL